MSAESPWKHLGVATPASDGAAPSRPEETRQVSQPEVATLFAALQRRNEERLAANEERLAAEALAARQAEELRVAQQERDRRAYLAWRVYRAQQQSELLRRVAGYAVAGVSFGVVTGALLAAFANTREAATP